MRNTKTSVTQWTRILRSVLCFALILTLALGNIVPLKVAKAEGEGESGGENTTSTTETTSTDLLNLDFSGTWETVGPQIGLSESSVTTDTAKTTYNLVQNGSNQYLKITYNELVDDTKSEYSLALTKFFANADKDKMTGKKVVYEYMLSAEDKDSLSTYFKALVGSGGTAPICVRSGGEMWFNTSKSGYSPFGTVTTGVWTRVAAVIDYSTESSGKYKYKLYVDDICVKDYDEVYITYPNGLKTTIPVPLGLRIYNSGHVLLDNIRVYIADNPDIKIVSSGTSSSYQQGSGKLATIQSTGDMKGLKSIAIGEDTIDTSNYTVVEGDQSTAIITLNEDFLESLAVDTHTITLNYDGNRSVESQLTIIARPVNIIPDETTTSYQKQSGSVVTINCDGSTDELQSVKIGEAKLDSGTHYTVSDAENTTMVTLKNDYLDTLVAGIYTITLGYSYDRTVTTDLVIKQPAATQKDIVNLDFEGEWAEFGSRIGVATSTTNAAFEQIVDPINGTNKCLKVTLQSDAELTVMQNCFVLGSDYPTDGKTIVYEYKLSAVEGEPIVNSAKILTYTYSKLLYLYSGSIKTSSKGDVLASVAAGAWTKLSLVVDYTNNRYDIYANDKIIVEDATFSNIGGIRLGMLKGGHVLIDDMRIYYGTEPLTEYIPASDGTVTLNTAATTTSYEKSTDAFVTVKTDGLTSELQSVKIKSDDLEETVLTKDTDYTLSDTVTTTVTLKNDYLNGLAAGEYMVTLVYSGDRSVETTLTVTPANISIVEEGTVTSYEKGSETVVTINCDGSAAELENVKIGDTVLADTAYVVADETASTTTVTLNNDYLYTLEPGEYTVTLVYSENRSVTSSLAITVAAVGITDGTTTSYLQGSTEEVKILADAPSDELVKVIVGTTELKETDYNVSGTDSTEITIASAILKTLLAGDCTITLNYTDNRSATTTLTVTPAEIALVPDGTTTSYLQRSGDTVTIKTDGFAAELLSVVIGEITLMKGTDYTVFGDVTTTITLAGNSLDALKAGNHTITLNYNNDRTVTSPLTVTEKAATQADIVNLDFEAEWAEFAYALGVDNPTAYVTQIIDPSDPANKALKVSSTGNKVTIGYVGAEGDVSGKQIVYEYKISAIPGEAISNSANLFTNHPIVTAHLRLYSTGSIKLAGQDDAVATLTAGEWTKIAMVINYADATETTTGTYKLYVDGICVKNDGVISNIDSTGADKGTQSYMRVRLSKAGHILIDDWRIYEASEPLAEYVEAPATTAGIVEAGTTASYQKETDNFVTIRSTGAKTDFVGVKVNGTELSVDNYVVSGVTEDTVVTLKNTYLDTLAADDYTVTLLFSGDRSVQSALKVTPAVVEIIADGTTTSFEVGKDTVATIKAARTYSDLQSVRLNGRELLEGTDYTVTGDEDTTTISFDQTYLNEMDAGVYTVTLEYSELRTAASTLTITYDPTNSELFIPDYIYLDFNGDWSEFGTYINKASGPSDTVLQVAVPTADNPDNKALKLVRNGSNVNIMFPSGNGFDFTGKQVVYEYKLSALEGEAITTNAKIFASRSDTRYLSVRSNGNIRFNNESNIDPLGVVAPGTWIDLAMVVDYVSSTYKIYVDGVCVKANGTFSDKTFMRITMAADGHLIIDDLRVYEGTEPHVQGTADPVGTNVYVNRTFGEVYKYDFEEILVTRNSGSVAVTQNAGSKYLRVAGTVASPGTVTYVTDEESNFIVAQAKLSVENATGNNGTVFTGVDPDGNEFALLNVVDNKVQLSDGTVVTTLTPGEWQEVAVALNVKEQTYTIYLDGYKVSGMINVQNAEIAAMASIVTKVTEGSVLIDDLRVYDAKKPNPVWKVNDTPDTIYVSDSEVKDLIGDARAIQLNANTLYADGVKNVATRAFDASEYGKVYLSLADIKTLFGENAVLTGVAMRNDCYDVITAAIANGYSYHYELEDRLLIFSATEYSLTDTNLDEMNKYMQFERPSIDKIKELYGQFVTASGGDTHPRLLVTQDDVTRIKNLYDSGEEYIKRWGDNAIAAAEAALTTPDFDYHITGSSMVHVNEALPMIINLGMAYFITDDAEAKAAYVAKAKSMAMIICNLEDWNPLSYLDVGELSFILGLAYDWFYDEYTEEERAFIEKNLMEKGVGIQNKIYYGQVDSSEVYWTWWDSKNNWGSVCNGGAMLGAVALFDVYPDICAQVISNSLHGLEFMMGTYYPEGVWPEGGGYWRYALNYLTYTLTTFDEVFGDDFGFLCSPGLDQTGWFGLKLSGSTGINNFGDAGTDFVNNPSVMWCATTFRDAELLAARLQEMELQGYTGAGRDMIWYDENLLDGKEVELPLDTVLDSMSVVSLRERWYDIGATFFSISGMKDKTGHSHMDMGAFVIDMLGERIIGDIGAENYNSSGYFSTSRYFYYRARPEGHNIYIINPTEDRADYGGYTPWVSTTNTPIVAKERGAYSTLNLSNVYAEDTNSAIRGFMLTDDRRSVIVRDEIDLKWASEIYSFMHTKATVEFDEENPDIAILTLNGTKYKVMIDVQGDCIEEYTFSAVAAESMADYGVTDTTNTGWCKLQVYVKTSGAGMVNITMKVIGAEDPAADKALITTPIAQWSADMIPDGEAPEIPTVDMIYLDGQPLKNFDPGVTGYTGRMSYTALLPVVTATSEKYDRIEITQAEDFGQDYVIKVYDNDDESLYRVYRLNYTKLPALKPVDGRVRYAVASATASESPQAESHGYTPESALDNDFVLSRWTAECANEGDSHWLMLELDEVSPVYKIGLSFPSGNKRYSTFKIEVSVDGETWTEVFNGRSSGTTEGLEYYYESESGINAKYVRYTGWGNSKNGWNNITEFVVLGPKTATEAYELGSNENLEILFNKTAGDLAGVTVDGVNVDADNYVVEEGNIDKVTLNAEYLETLAAGEYELVLNYQDGSNVKLTLVVEAAGEVTIIEEGTVGTYQKESGDKVSIHCSGLMTDLIGVKVDDQLISHSNYEVTEGSTIVTFKESYLESLGVGTHKVTLMYSKGRSVNSWLVVEAAAQTPDPEETTGGADETTSGADETTDGADETTEAGTGSAGGEGSAEVETTTEADESTEAEGSTGAEESTEADVSTEAGTDSAPGGDPDTGDFAGAARWIWLIVVEMVLMAAYVIFFGFDRKKQK